MAISKGVTELPGNMALGATRSAELAEQSGHILGRELLAMGINLNFAPSVDVNINSNNPAIGIRSFGDEPDLVARLGLAVIRGMQAVGVMATAKHFPGHGDIKTDTHDAEVIISHSLERVNAVELVPFKAAIQAGVGAVMSAHILFTALDPARPATLSPIVLDGLLRQKLGFEGLIITDAMDMRAVAQRGRLESLRMALEAGADLVLLGHLTDQLELNNQLAHMARLDSLARIQTARQRIQTIQPPLDILGCPEHQAIAQQIADRSITLVKNGGQIPLKLASDDLVAVITPEPVNLTPADTSASVRITLAEHVQRRHLYTLALQLPHKASTQEIAAIAEVAGRAQVVIVGTINANHDSSQIALVRELIQRGKRPIVAALRTPYDLSAFPMIETYLCAYGIRSVSMRALARVLFGDLVAEGSLPCLVPSAAVT
jgi:beta-N-acetylhexosaminidase